MAAASAVTLMEDTFSKYLAGTIDSVALCKNLTVCLNNFSDVENSPKFTPYITNEDSSSKFFGFRVFPSIEGASKYCSGIIGDMYHDNEINLQTAINTWKGISEWVIEIDASLFSITGINFTPKELCALLIHEIGHVIYSETGITYLYDALRSQRDKLSTKEKAIHKVANIMYMLPITKVCMQRGWVNEQNIINVQMIADETIVTLGYGEFLETALNKILKHCGTVVSNKVKNYAEVYSSVEWVTLNIKDVTKRRSHLKDSLYYEAIKASSTYVKAACVEILSSLGMKLRENYKGYAVENTIELLSTKDLMKTHSCIFDGLKYDAIESRAEMSIHSVLGLESVSEKISTDGIVLEGILNSRKKVRAVLPSQYEIDMIAVEVDKITNHHDRVFVLDLIYEVLERINLFEEAISPDSSLVRKWDTKIKAMKEELAMLRKATLEKKNFSKGYKFFVKLPPEAADYEG